VYACSNRALAALEFLIRVRQADAARDLVLLSIETPDVPRVERIPEDRLPGSWQQVPVPTACQSLGDRWLARRRNLVLEAPSVLMPEESNLLINPTHPDFKAVRVIAQRPFSFDPRLIR
jgi:RES domain-containing protein